ncbi:hypothetical protein LEM8419_01260 [Neolewinella maritima]|uniref:Stress-response A/B barrel domain-containing protein n=1 Tax=Neolewinella maritima TaxID=1383882 RepID=A0ABM9AZL2_9BACT|nr:Dabb family protein [Neolewinella maritima]CAH1000102.1 hypothetical protein LEM8419_01260 [Neolewinella maritima]
MMHRTLWLTCLLFLGLLLPACSVNTAQSTSPMATPSTPGMAHTVYFWLKDGLSAEELASFEAGMKSLQAAPSVRRAFVGAPAATPSREVVDNSFDYSLVLWFDDVAGHDAYQVSPTHLKFVEDHEAKFDVVKVFDNMLLN